MARVVTEKQGPKEGTVIPDEVRLYSGDEDVTGHYEVEITSRTGQIWVHATSREGATVTAFSIDGPTGHALRYPVEALWFPHDGCDLGLGPVVLSA